MFILILPSLNKHLIHYPSYTKSRCLINTLPHSAICKTKHLKPKYIHFKTNNKTTRDKRTINNATAHRINQEISFLYCKKQNLNKQLYHIHLEYANQLNSKWSRYQMQPDCLSRQNYRRLWTSIKNLIRNWTH
jgi:hypothetical protein